MLSSTHEFNQHNDGEVMKAKQEVIKSLTAITAQKSAVIARFKENFDSDPKGSVKWNGWDVMVYDEAGSWAAKFIAHLQTLDDAKSAEYISSRAKICIECTVNQNCRNEDSLATREAWIILWRAFESLLD